MGASTEVVDRRNEYSRVWQTGIAVPSGPRTLSNAPAWIFATGEQPILADGEEKTVVDSTVKTSGHEEHGVTVRNGGSATFVNSQIVTHGRNANAVNVSIGGKADLVGSTAMTHDDFTHALSANGADSWISVRGGEVGTSGFEATAVRATDGAHIELDKVSINTLGQNSTGVSLHESTMAASGTDIVSAQGIGMAVFGGSVTFSDGSIVAYSEAIQLGSPWAGSHSPIAADIRDSSIRSESGMGIKVLGQNTQATLDRVHISVGSPGSQLLNTGVWIQGRDSQMTLRDSRIDAYGNGNAGVFSVAGDMTLENSDIKVHGDLSGGVIADGYGEAMAITMRNVAIETLGAGSLGALVSRADFVMEGGSVVTLGKEAHGVKSDSGSLSISGSKVYTYGDVAHGVITGDQHARMESVDVKTHGAGADALWHYALAPGNSPATLNIGGGSHIEAKDGAAIQAIGGDLSISLSDSTLIGGSLGGQGVLLRTVDWNESGQSVPAGRVVLDAERSRLKGDIVPERGSVSLSLRDHSSLHGALRDVAGSSVEKMTIDSSSVWYVGNSSVVQDLEASGTVSLNTSGKAFKVLDVTGDLTGDALFEMASDVGSGQSDKLRIGGTVEGNHRVLVANSGAEPATSGGSLQLIQTEGGSGSFALANRGQAVDVGTYRYTLVSDNAVGGRSSDWSLVHSGTVPQEPSPPVAPPGANALSTAANAAVNTSAAGTAQAIWHAESATLMQRLGQLRQDKGVGGLWTRGFGQRQKIDNRGGRDFDQTVGGVMIGADVTLPTATGRWHLGGMVGYSDVDRRFPDDGKGGADSYQVGSYATWVGDGGWYLDGVFKANRILQDFDVTATDGKAVTASSSRGAVGVSLETGRQFQLADDWYVEPLLGASTVRVGSDRYRASNGLLVEGDGGNSLQLRGGVLIGRRFLLNDGKVLQPYVKVARAHEFKGKGVVRTNGIATNTDYSGGRTDIGLGLAAMLGTNHRLYTDYEYSSGKQMDRPWAFNLGYRYSW